MTKDEISAQTASALFAGLSEVGAALGGLIGEREVALASRTSLSVELVEPVTVSRPKQSSPAAVAARTVSSDPLQSL